MELIRKAVPVGMATIIAALAVLGVEGDLLDRFIRDHPNQVAIGLVLAAVGVSLPIVLGAENLATKVGIGLLTSGVVFAIWTGANGVGEREQPQIDVTPIAIDEQRNSVTVQYVASGTHLRSDDRLLLRAGGVVARNATEASQRCDSAPLSAPGPSDAFWGESGPDLKGEATTSITLTIPLKGYRYACAYAALSDRDTVNPDDDRVTKSVVDLAAMEVQPNQEVTP